jgi:hypothetical protein
MAFDDRKFGGTGTVDRSESVNTNNPNGVSIYNFLPVALLGEGAYG